MRFFAAVSEATFQYADQKNLEYLAALSIILAGASALGYICYCWNEIGMWWAPNEEVERNLAQHIQCCCGPCMNSCCYCCEGEQTHIPVLSYTAP